MDRPAGCPPEPRLEGADVPVHRRHLCAGKGIGQGRRDHHDPVAVRPLRVAEPSLQVHERLSQGHQELDRESQRLVPRRGDRRAVEEEASQEPERCRPGQQPREGAPAPWSPDDPPRRAGHKADRRQRDDSQRKRHRQEVRVPETTDQDPTEQDHQCDARDPDRNHQTREREDASHVTISLEEKLRKGRGPHGPGACVCGKAPTCSPLQRALSRGFKHHTVLTSCAETHTLPSPALTAPLPCAGPNRLITLFVFGSITDKRTLVARTQTAPSPAAMSPPGPGTPTSMVATTSFVFGSILETVPSALVQYPHGTLADREKSRLTVDRDGRNDRICLGVNPLDRTVFRRARFTGIRDPDRPISSGCRVGIRFHADAGHDFIRLRD